MRMTLLTLTAALFLSSGAFAYDTKTSTSADATVKEVAGTEKKSKKNKGEMCTECGKSKKDCECHDKKGETK